MKALRKQDKRWQWRGALLVFGFCAVVSVFSSCEDDPIVEPKGGTKTGGSYGGRLALPDPGSKKTTSETAAPVNPELF